MRVPRFHGRPRLTVRSLMVLVALVALGMSSWQAVRHRSECMRGERSVRELGLSMEEIALTVRELAQEVEGDPKLFERGNPEGDFLRAEWSGDFPAAEIQSAPTFVSSLRRRSAELDALRLQCKAYEHQYHRASLRPWVDVHSIDRDVERTKFEFRRSHNAAGSTVTE